jgi:hypothetical protein
VREALLEAVARIRPEIERAAGAVEALMTLPALSVDLLTESGLFRIKLAEVLGGHEADLITQFEVIEAMSFADAASGWCLMIGATCIAHPGAYLPDASIEEMFQGSTVPRPTASIPPVGIWAGVPCTSRTSWSTPFETSTRRPSTSWSAAQPTRRTASRYSAC